jgi:hypothetical protein
VTSSTGFHRGSRIRILPLVSAVRDDTKIRSWNCRWSKLGGVLGGSFAAKDLGTGGKRPSK